MVFLYNIFVVFLYNMKVSKRRDKIDKKTRQKMNWLSSLMILHKLEIHEKTSGRIPLICASNHFLTHKKDCPWYGQVEEWCNPIVPLCKHTVPGSSASFSAVLRNHVQVSEFLNIILALFSLSAKPTSPPHGGKHLKILIFKLIWPFQS